MATKIAEFDFNSSSYDWKSWLDGDIWQLVHGEDFTVDITSMRSAVWGAARARGMRVRGAWDSKAKTFTIQAYTPE